jgi:hypothetical protein
MHRCCFSNGGFRACALLAAALSLAAQSRPLIGKSARYINPLPLEASSRDGSPQGLGLGDVTVVREGDSRYLFGNDGGSLSGKSNAARTVEMRAESAKGHP